MKKQNTRKWFHRYKYSLILAGIVTLAFIAGMAAGSALRATATDSTDAETEPVPIVYEEPDKISLGAFQLTGYCICSDCCGGYSDGYTATMTIATPGRTVAVDPDVIPYGSKLEINGEEYIAEDCGGAIKGNHIDVLCASHELAEAFGVQYAEVYLVTE